MDAAHDQFSDRIRDSLGRRDEMPSEGAIGAQLAGIQSDLSSLTTDTAVIKTRLDILISSSTDHEGRIRNLESFRWKMTGIAVGVSVLFSGLGAWVGVIVSHH